MKQRKKAIVAAALIVSVAAAIAFVRHRGGEPAASCKVWDGPSADFVLGKTKLRIPRVYLMNPRQDSPAPAIEVNLPDAVPAFLDRRECLNGSPDTSDLMLVTFSTDPVPASEQQLKELLGATRDSKSFSLVGKDGLTRNLVCDAPEDKVTSFSRCETLYRDKHGFSVRYRFGMRYLAQWPAVDAKVSALVDRFVIE